MKQGQERYIFVVNYELPISGWGFEKVYMAKRSVANKINLLCMNIIVGTHMDF